MQKLGPPGRVLGYEGSTSVLQKKRLDAVGSHPLLGRHLSNGIPGGCGLHGTILETEAGLLSDAKPDST